MRSRTRSITYLILFVVGLAIGIRLGVLFVEDVREDGSITRIWPSLTPTDDTLDQRSILIVGVDRVGTTQARLQAIWFAAYRPEYPVLTLLPLYPASHLSDPEQARLLEEAFTLDIAGELHPNFLNTVKAEFNLSWQVVLLVDDFAMMSLVDFMGGVVLDSAPINGITAIGNIPPAWEDPGGALQGQIELLKALCHQISLDDQDRNPESLHQLLPGHLRTQPATLAQLQSDWLAMLLLGSEIHCDFQNPANPAS